MSNKNFSYYANDKSRCGRMSNPQIASCVKGAAGDVIEFNLTVKEDQIVEISFHAQGCREVFACSAAIADMMDNAYIYKGRGLCADTVMKQLQDSAIPIDHWAILAVRSFSQALEQVFYKKYLENKFNLN